jgi:hypothetical protein
MKLEPNISVSWQQRTYALDGAVTGISRLSTRIFVFQICGLGMSECAFLKTLYLFQHMWEINAV